MGSHGSPRHSGRQSPHRRPEVNGRGIVTKEGRPWHHSTVRTVLSDSHVAGLRVHRREIAGPATWAPIPDRDLWEQVRGVLADPARKRTRPAQRYLLAGLVSNATGQPMNGRPDKGRRTYSTRHGSDPSVSIGADELEGHAVALVLAALDDAVVPTAPLANGGDSGAVEHLEAELAELARLRGEGVVTLAEWLAAREPLQARLAAARADVAARPRPSAMRNFIEGPGRFSGPRGRGWLSHSNVRLSESQSTELSSNPQVGTVAADLANHVVLVWRV